MSDQAYSSDSQQQTMPAPSLFGNYQTQVADDPQSLQQQNESEGIVNNSDKKKSATANSTASVMKVRPASSPLSNLDHMKEALPDLPK
jgi:hypothetical protein